jgi:hypothetical protein
MFLLFIHRALTGEAAPFVLLHNSGMLATIQFVNSRSQRTGPAT